MISGETCGVGGIGMIEIIKAEDPPINASSALKTKIDQRDQPRSRNRPTDVVMPQPAKPSSTTHITRLTTFKNGGAFGCAVGTNADSSIASPNRTRSPDPRIAATAARVTPSGRLAVMDFPPVYSNANTHTDPPS